MTVQSQISRITQNGDGSTVTFPVSFYFLADGDLTVIVDGVTQTITTDYTVTGAGNPAGGSVTFTTAPASGTGNVVIFRDPDLTQLLDYIENDDFPAESHERGLDKLTMLVQRLNDLVSRSVKLGDSVSTAFDPTLPAINTSLPLLGLTPGGDGLQGYPLGSTPQDAGSTVYAPAGTGAVATTVEQKLRGFVTPEDYGGSAVVNSIILAMTQASALGVPMQCNPVDYPTNQSMFLPDNFEWHANGCRVVATTDSSSPAIKTVKNNINIKGLLRVFLSDPGGTPTANRGHILVGDYLNPLFNPSGFFFDDIKFEGGHFNCTAFGVAGGANNIKGRSLSCGDSDKIGRVFSAHWGNFNGHFLSGGVYQHAIGAGPTTHPHNIKIEEITSGELTVNTGDFVHVFTVSAGYDIKVGRIKGVVNNLGVGGSDVVLLTAGDLGFAYATEEERLNGMWGIRIDSVIGECARNGINRIGRALNFDTDSTPQPADYYFAKIEDTIDYIRIKSTGTITQVISGSNGYGKTRYGVVMAEGGLVCASFTNYERDTVIDVLRCKNSVTKALQIAGSGGDTTIHPSNIEIKSLEIDRTDAGGSGTQANSIGFLIASARNIKIGTVMVKALANNGFAGQISTNVKNICVGDTFLADNYNPALSFAYTNSAGFSDYVHLGNLFAPATVISPVSGGVTFSTAGRNREWHATSGFPAGLAVNNGDRVWVTAASGVALVQVKTSGLIGTTAVTKDQLTYT